MKLLHRLAMTTAGIAAACALSMACRQLVGIGEDPPTSVPSDAKDGGTEAGPRCGIGYEGKTCEACLATHCCAKANACAGSTSCNQLETCLGSCAGDASCRAACLQEHRVGTGRELPAFDSCMVAECSTACGLVCGGVAAISTPDAATACQDCFVNKVCTPIAGCLGDLSCADYAWCLLAAPTPDTFAACAQLLDGGQDGSSAVIGLGAAYCGPQCALTSNWSCVGRVAWPPGAMQDLTIVLQLIDGATLQPTPGVTAKLCAGGDEACAGPLATGLTDATGTVALSQQPETGSVVPNGYIDLSGAGIVPEVFFWSFPLSEHRATLSAVTITPDEANTIDKGTGIVADPSKGTIYVIGHDCYQQSGRGMQFSVSPAGSSPPVYLQGTVFAPGATATDDTGGAIVLNVPPGAGVLTASVAAAGGGIGQFSYLVRAGGLTEVWALPK